MKSEADMPQDILDMGEAAFENLRGFEEELMVLLDMFDKGEQESSSISSTEAEVLPQQQDDDDEAVPDLMSEGLTCWTDLLMDDLPNDKLLAIPDYGPLSPSGFLSIGLAPHQSTMIQPSLPASLFPTRSADSSTAEALAQEARLCEPTNEPAAPDLLRQSDAASWSPLDIDGSLLDPVPRENLADHAAEQNGTNSAASSHTQASVEGQECSTTQQKSVKRKRPRKGRQRDPTALKRRPGRPRATPGLNCLKHIKAFQEEGGFTSEPGALTEALLGASIPQQDANNEAQI